MANRNTIISSKLLSLNQQSALFSLNIKIKDIIEFYDKDRKVRIYYYHFNYNKPQSLKVLYSKFKLLNINYKFCTTLTNYGEYFYTAIILIKIPVLCLKYLEKGAASNIKHVTYDNNLMLFS